MFRKLIRKYAICRSKKKWKRIARGKDVDRGSKNCFLCKVYHGDSCLACPIFKKSGQGGCHDTPYDDWVDHHYREHEHIYIDTKVECPECKKIAEREVEFLGSLK